MIHIEHVLKCKGRHSLYKPEFLMVSISGVRGLLGNGMNPELAARFTAAYAAWLKGALVIVGRDTRASGPAISLAVFSALRFKGVDVIDLGVAATPTVELMVRELEADGGIIITASHNDERWNALKFVDGNGEFLGSDAVDEIRESVDGGGVLYEPPGYLGSYKQIDSADMVHVERILSLECIDREKIASRGFRVVIDCVNGAGSRIIPILLGELGVDKVELFTDIHKPFPHDPEPKPANLGELSEAVIREKADLGFACDPDADRLVLVDGKGKVLSEELTLSLAVDFILSREKGPVVANLSTTRLIDDIAKKHGVRSIRSKVGEANVISAMKESGAVIGGEGNGGVIYPPIHYGRDAMTGIALILQLLARSETSLEEKVTSFPEYCIVKEKFLFNGELEGIIEDLKKEFPGEFNSLDGIRIDIETGWIHIRKSNTEPVIRIIAEAESERDALVLVKRARAILMSHS